MIYYRTPAARPESRPPELAGWQAFCIYSLMERIEGAWRYAGVVEPDKLTGTAWFTPPEKGPWFDIGGGWEACNTEQDWSPLMFARNADALPFDVYTVDIGHHEWMVAKIVTEAGGRAFPVKFGPGFKPMLTAQQEEAMRRAEEVRASFMGGHAMPMEMQAECAAWFLGLCYHLSPATIAACGMLDEVSVEVILKLAAGIPAHGD